MEYLDKLPYCEVYKLIKLLKPYMEKEAEALK